MYKAFEDVLFLLAQSFARIHICIAYAQVNIASFKRTEKERIKKGNFPPLTTLRLRWKKRFDLKILAMRSKVTLKFI